ncbi:hypothetical protein NPIL_235061 [Nephila pilipes]|uniref:Uncharacterized protein n=1 Tax=Nephila pilipes TaxID=299642 RepID=A0A8X6I411_NEPPI|nr:hypothetical protein NPIL_235061 [Nephila pilipes]
MFKSEFVPTSKTVLLYWSITVAEFSTVTPLAVDSAPATYTPRELNMGASSSDADKRGRFKDFNFMVLCIHYDTATNSYSGIS